MKLVNITPHSVNIHDEHRNLICTVEPSKDTPIPRVSVERLRVMVVDGLPFFADQTGPIVDLPPIVDLQTRYIVSTMVRMHPDASDRIDLVSPGELIRDEEGRPIGCIGLVCNV
jgi:hypothetical protein